MKYIVVVVAVALTCASSPASTQQTPVPTFRSGLEILTVEASVRDAVSRFHNWITAAPAVVTATATYSDFKRFETSTSISVK